MEKKLPQKGCTIWETPSLYLLRSKTMDGGALREKKVNDCTAIFLNFTA